MATKENEDKNHLPEEWNELVEETMRSNITKEEFKQFLKEEKKKRKKDFM